MENRYKILFDRCGQYKQGDVVSAHMIAATQKDLQYLIDNGVVQETDEPERINTEAPIVAEKIDKAVKAAVEGKDREIAAKDKEIRALKDKIKTLEEAAKAKGKTEGGGDTPPAATVEERVAKLVKSKSLEKLKKQATDAGITVPEDADKEAIAKLIVADEDSEEEVPEE